MSRWRRPLARARRARRHLAYDAQGAVAELVRRLDRQHERLAALERDLARIGPQVAALEARVEDLRDTRAPVGALVGPAGTPSVDPEELAEARSLVAEVRREHERTRARVSAAARFEERLEQVEEIVAALPRRTP